MLTEMLVFCCPNLESESNRFIQHKKENEINNYLYSNYYDYNNDKDIDI